MIKFNKKFIVMVILSSIYAILGGGLFPYLIFYSMTAVLTMACIYIIIINYMLDVNVVFKKDYYCAGDRSECITQVNCAAFLPIPYVEIRSPAFVNSDCKYIGEISNITLEENKWVTSNIVFLRRGIYDLGNVDLTIMDLFHIVTLKKKIDVNAKIKVYPKIYELKIPTNGANDIYHESVDRNSMNEDPFQIKDVRKYRAGDSLKKIHWKVSAKFGELFVKNSENISGEETVLFLDMIKHNFKYNDKGRLEETIIDLGISIIRRMRSIDKEIKVFLNSACPMLYRIHSKDVENNISESLIQQISDGESTIEDYIYKNVYKIHKASRIIIVTACLREDFVQSMLALKMSGYLLSVYYCEGLDSNKTNEDMLNRWGVECECFEEIVNRSGGSSNESY